MGEIAQQMMADLADQPVHAIPELFPGYGTHYATPMVDVRGAIFSDQGILLVKEKSDQRWTLPGGYADVGRSAGENVIKEICEEAGLHVSVAKLFAIRHKAKHDYDPDLRDFYKFFFLCDWDQNQVAAPGDETSEVGFFGLDQLPTLSTGRVTQKDIELAFEHAADSQLDPSVD